MPIFRDEDMTQDQDMAQAGNKRATAIAVRLPLREKIGYGIGDFGFNLYWANISAFLLIFYTDVMGLAAGAVGTMMLVTKLVDAVADPFMGAIADRTRSRWGRFRPYLLFGALPLAVESGTGAELRFPLGISIIGGLLLSQLLTLYTTPVIYLALDRLNRKIEKAVPDPGPPGPTVAGATEGMQ